MLPERSSWDEFKSNWPYLLTLAPLTLQWDQARGGWDSWASLGSNALVTILTLALVVVIQWQRRALEEASITDKLTGLFNSRHLRRELDLQAAHAHEDSVPLSMIFLDIDGFKAVNDRFGHALGDKILRRFAQSIRRAVRQRIDLCFRFGGDELLVLCPRTDAAEAADIARRFVRVPLDLPGHHDVKVSFSYSVTQLQPAESARRFLLRADEALYRAKRARGVMSVPP